MHRFLRLPRELRLRRYFQKVHLSTNGFNELYNILVLLLPRLCCYPHRLLHLVEQIPRKSKNKEIDWVIAIDVIDVEQEFSRIVAVLTVIYGVVVIVPAVAVLTDLFGGYELAKLTIRITINTNATTAYIIVTEPTTGPGVTSLITTSHDEPGRAEGKYKG